MEENSTCKKCGASVCESCENCSCPSCPTHDEEGVYEKALSGRDERRRDG